MLAFFYILESRSKISVRWELICNFLYLLLLVRWLGLFLSFIPRFIRLRCDCTYIHTLSVVLHFLPPE